MGKKERLQAIEELQAVRGGSVVITYITSTRPNYESLMAMDVIPIFHQHLSRITTARDETRIDLFLSTNGGDGVVPWKLVTLLREYCSELTVIVPYRCFSAGTLACLGADKVIMHPMGMLGPVDPTVANEFNPPHPSIPGRYLGISVEDVASYIQLVKEDVGIRHEDELIMAFNQLSEKIHPLALGNVKRHTLQSEMMGRKLLRTRGPDQLDDHDVDEIVKKLTSQSYFHGHPINRKEAREDIGLSFVTDASEDEASAMWSLYMHYVVDNQLEEAWLPIQEACRIIPPPVPALGGNATQTNIHLPKVRAVSVESTLRSDVYEEEYEITMIRFENGSINADLLPLRQEWLVE